MCQSDRHPEEVMNWEDCRKRPDVTWTIAKRIFEDQAEEIRSLEKQLAEIEESYDAMRKSSCWRATAPLRAVLDFIKWWPRQRQKRALLLKGIKNLRKNGVADTLKRTRQKMAQPQYSSETLQPLYLDEDLSAQRETAFPRDIKFSIIVPLYNTPALFLEQMISSVQKQTYENWELCLADGSDEKHPDVQRICAAYAAGDKRIVYQKLSRNGGISENTNAGIDMATGDWIALLDHDDLLHPCALYEAMKAICEQDCDMVYTDEVVFNSPDVNQIVSVHFKPDFAIDNLRANNYICHFCAFSRQTLEEAGRFRSQFDGSQDHDLMLRLTAKAKKVVHIPKALYYWRSHPQSVAMDISSKEYAVTSGQNAVRASIVESGYDAQVSSSEAFPAIYRIQYELKERPKVSILILNRNHAEDLKRCVESILERTTYDNYEIVLVDNASDDAEILAYYDTLRNDGRFQIRAADGQFNYAALCNLAAKAATGRYYILLHRDVEVITPEWIEEMIMYAQREDVAAVGAMLYYPDDTVQHAGMILGLGAERIAGYPFSSRPRDSIGYMGRMCYAQDLSAVSSACMMVKAGAYWAVGGLDETLHESYFDVDFCLKLRKAGNLIVWTPYARLYHHRPKKKRKSDVFESRVDAAIDVLRLEARWERELSAGDPYYNPNFQRQEEKYFLK